MLLLAFCGDSAHGGIKMATGKDSTNKPLLWCRSSLQVIRLQCLVRALAFAELEGIEMHHQLLCLVLEAANPSIKTFLALLTLQIAAVVRR
jgi:hypothetical protein